jgi:hypothetical protein
VDHLRTSGAQFAASILGPSKALITITASTLFLQVVTMRGDALHTVARSLVFLFPTLVLVPHRAGSPSSSAKAETEAKIVFCQRGELRELTSKVVAARLEHLPGNCSKKSKVDRRATTLLRHNMFARAAGLAVSKGLANATQNTLDAIPDMFKEPCHVNEDTLRRLYGPRVTPTRESMAVTDIPEDVYKCIAVVAPLTTPHKDGWRAEHLLALCKGHDYRAAFTDVIIALATGMSLMKPVIFCRLPP